MNPDAPITEVALTEAADIILVLRDRVTTLREQVDSLTAQVATLTDISNVLVPAAASAPTHVLVNHRRPEGTSTMHVLGAELDSQGTLTVTVSE